MVICTSHLFDRSEERMGIHSHDETLNKAQRAWRNGKTADDYSGKAQKLILKVERKYDNNTTIRVFSGFFFIFKKNGVLVTVYEAPQWLLNSNRPKRRYFRGEDDIFASEYGDKLLIKLLMRHFVSFFIFIQ